MAVAKAQILLIEDEEDIRELVRYNLERENFAVTEAESGEVGLKAAAQKKPIFVSAALFEQVEDMSEVLDKMNESGGEAETD